MAVGELEQNYQQLHEKLLRGEMTEDEFKAEVDQLRFSDDLGNQWKLGWYTGKWYRYDDGQWIQDQPLDKQAPAKPAPAVSEAPPPEDTRKRRSLAPCLVIALIGVLLLASIALIFGWNADWLTRTAGDTVAVASATAEEESTTEATATAIASSAPSDTPRPAASPTTAPTHISRATTAPSRTPPPTATIQRATATPSAQTPTASPTETVAPSPTTTASPAPTATASPVSTAVLPAEPTSTAAPSLSGRIYFPVFDPNPDRQTFDIHVYRLDDRERAVVIGQASQPAVSSDGKRLAYRSWDSGQRGIMVLDLPGGNTWRWVSFHEAAHPSWAPDGQNIVIASQQESDRRWRIYRTWGLELDRVRREGGDIFGRVPVWAADGRIVYWECPIDKCGLYAMHSDGTNLTRLSGQEHDTAPAASPDGNQIAFMSNKGGNWEVYVTTTRPPEGENIPEPKRMTQNPARDGLPVWSPDGRWLAFVSDRGGAWAVWAIRANGSEEQKLFDLGGSLEGIVANIPPQEQQDWTWETLAWSR